MLKGEKRKIPRAKMERFGAVCFGLMIRYLGLECAREVFEHGPVDEKRYSHLRYYTYCTEYDIHTIDCPYNIQHYTSTTVNRCMRIHPSTHTYIYIYMLGEAADHERPPIAVVINTHSSRGYPVN
ncbi:uncharacterized protein ASPGLDRAFT_1379876 [Aspergillus glaucus CBS 516.65]|uniref:Uncharacterized protein n=1 Tax=Aspergillus glaucus CBS 516.65 TaxID=1160497 RepID=A0A1L9VP59_ASPGL|nr:hypothetical protein ASPGLDRAFT_1379876 [Aspergillus glaucus CBS 516.65]OJJ85670.1 hypothetical protein ASPGLDRAFT_1379876 [Aspergillus glaucus CBS 516.65]